MPKQNKGISLCFTSPHIPEGIVLQTTTSFPSPSSPLTGSNKLLLLCKQFATCWWTWNTSQKIPHSQLGVTLNPTLLDWTSLTELIRVVCGNLSVSASGPHTAPSTELSCSANNCPRLSSMVEANMDPPALPHTQGDTFVFLHNSDQAR